MNNSLNTVCWILSVDVAESNLPLSLTFRQMSMFLLPLGAFSWNLGPFSYVRKPIVFQGDTQKCTHRYKYIYMNVSMQVCSCMYVGKSAI